MPKFFPAQITQGNVMSIEQVAFFNDHLYQLQTEETARLVGIKRLFRFIKFLFVKV